jgi:hypothetical protein
MKKNHSLKIRRRRQAAFSLVEVVLAIGIVAFAFVGVFGLIPTGLNSFHQSIDISVCSEIAQHVINDAQQSDWSDLITDYTGATISGTSGMKSYRFFDGQGLEVIPATATAGNPTTAPTGLAAAEKLKIIYWVNTRVMPATVTPNTGNSSNPCIATVTVQVANNPGNQALYVTPGANLWNGAYASSSTNPVVPLKSFSALVSRIR